MQRMYVGCHCTVIGRFYYRIDCSWGKDGYGVELSNVQQNVAEKEW